MIVCICNNVIFYKHRSFVIQKKYNYFLSVIFNTSRSFSSCRSINLQEMHITQYWKLRSSTKILNAIKQNEPRLKEMIE